MRIMKRLQMDLLEDREVMKVRINLISENGFIVGWLKPMRSD